MTAVASHMRWLDRQERRHGCLAHTVRMWTRPAFLAGYRAAQRAEAASRRLLAEAEAAIAEQVAHGGDAGESDVLDAAETERAAAKLLSGLGEKRKRRAA
jgi:hypothetical protein